MKNLSKIIVAVVCVLCTAAAGVIGAQISANVTRQSYQEEIAILESRHESEIVALNEKIAEKNELIDAKDEEYVNTRFKMFDPTKLETILRELAVNEYYESLTYEELTDAVCAAYLDSLGDPYAYFYTEEELNDTYAATYKGIGVQVIFDTERGAVQVVTPFPDTPADKAGILPGDYIVAVGDTPISDLDTAVSLIRGEVGTSVTITVERNGEQFEVTMERADVENVSIMYHTIEATDTTPKTGYIKILEFNGTESTTAVQFLEAVKACEADGVEAYIFDVRYCPGGDLYSVLNITKFVLPVNVNDVLTRIDYTVERDDFTIDALTAAWSIAYLGRTDISSSGINISSKPMVVLTNGNTASGGELFASSLKDYAAEGRIDATLIGTQTFGKGIMQSVIELDDGSAFKMTSGYYYPPMSDNFHGIGVEPDIVLDIDESLKDKNIYKITDEEDNQIQAALSHLAGRLK